MRFKICEKYTWNLSFTILAQMKVTITAGRKLSLPVKLFNIIWWKFTELFWWYTFSTANPQNLIWFLTAFCKTREHFLNTFIAEVFITNIAIVISFCLQTPWTQLWWMWNLWHDVQSTFVSFKGMDSICVNSLLLYTSLWLQVKSKVTELFSLKINVLG